MYRGLIFHVLTNLTESMIWMDYLSVCVCCFWRIWKFVCFLSTFWYINKNSARTVLVWPISNISFLLDFLFRFTIQQGSYSERKKKKPKYVADLPYPVCSLCICANQLMPLSAALKQLFNLAQGKVNVR